MIPDELYDVWLSARHRAQTDLFWLCRLLGYAVTVKAHRRLTDEFFLKKDPSIPFSDMIGDSKQDRLLFYPRDSYKSSIANADCVQWIICYPDIKVGIQSSKLPRAEGFVDEIKSFFLAPEDADGSLKLTLFQMLFPEHVLPERSRGASGSFTTPARRKFSKESTVQALSVEESKASVHFNVLRNDDVISEINSGAESLPEARRNVTNRYLESRNLGEIIFHIGTPQAEDDGYAVLQENLGSDLFVMSAPAWTLKDASATKPEAERTADDYELLFPFDATGKSKLSYKVLRSAQRANPDSFSTQQLCRLPASTRSRITEGQIRAHVISPTQGDAKSVMAVDLGYSLDKYDFSVSSVGFKDPIRGTIVQDVVRGRWDKPGLVRALAEQAARFHVQNIFIEDSQGARWLHEDILSALRTVGCTTTRIVYFPIDGTPNAKQLRFDSLAAAIKADAFYLSNEIPPSMMEFICDELSKFNPRSSRRRDDICDSLGHLLRKLSEPIPQVEEPRDAARELLQQKLLRDMVYGVRQEPTPRAEPVPEMPTEYDGYPVFKNSEDNHETNRLH